MTINEIREAVARGWCAEPNWGKVMDVDLAEAISQEVFKANVTPQLGCATTAELLVELAARAEIGGYADYKTVNGEFVTAIPSTK
jgi:hypothetical protein